jgi:hypothetical protein
MRTLLHSATLLALALTAHAQLAQPVLEPVGPLLKSWTPQTPGGGSWLNNNYLWDDGTCENGMTFQTTVSQAYEIGWINGYDAVGGSDTIINVLTTFGNPNTSSQTLTNGMPANVAVWEDPNDDGNPNDAVLLTQSAVFTANVYTNTFNSYAVTPVQVQGHFFVGCWMPIMTSSIPPVAGVGMFPAPLDNSSAAPMQSFYVGGLPINVVNLSANANPVTDVTTFIQSHFMVRGEGSASAPTNYCTAKTGSVGCNPTMASSGAASASAGSGFLVQGTNFINNKSCLLFYGVSGQAATSFQGGILCVKAPIKRTPGTNTFGNPPPNDCSGVPAIDMNLFAVGGGGGTPLPALTVSGTVVDCQWWGRDPGFAAPFNTQLSDGLHYTVGP